MDYSTPKIVILFGLLTSAVAAERSAYSADQPGDQPPSITAHYEQLVPLIVTFEIARRHAELWESNPAAETLVKQMMADLIADADLDLRWTTQFFLAERDKQVPDAFDQDALAKLHKTPTNERQVWSRDGQRAIVAVKARNSCINCHAAKAGDLLGCVSLRLSLGRPLAAPVESAGP